MMHIAYSPYFKQIYKFPLIFVHFSFSWLPPTLTMMHLRIILNMSWTPLIIEQFTTLYLAPILSYLRLRFTFEVLSPFPEAVTCFFHQVIIFPWRLLRHF